MELGVTPPELKNVRRKQREDHKKKQALSKGRKCMPEFSNKTEFLLHVGAMDCIKAHKKWKATLQSILVRKGQTSEMTRKSH